MASIAEEISSEFARHQNHDCRAMKNVLLDLGRDTGRVPLARFYEPYMESRFGFGERPEFLRYIGALDDSDPNRVSVIVPNYLTAKTNCVAGTSTFQQVCCISECEKLMLSLETALGRPEAAPGQIL